MPLIVVTGYPSSGKSTTAQLIFEYFRSRMRHLNDTRIVRIVTDSDTLDWEGRNNIYTNIVKEKELRAWLKSEAQRYVNLNQIVILDSSAYIKGFRYELYCVSKEARTQYCIVERLIDPTECWKWNEKTSTDYELGNPDYDPDEPEPGYDREVFDGLMMRYEPCDDTNRWDEPLFRQTSLNDDLDLAKIFKVVIEDPPLMPNKSTAMVSTTRTMYRPRK